MYEGYVDPAHTKTERWIKAWDKEKERKKYSKFCTFHSTVTTEHKTNDPVGLPGSNTVLQHLLQN